MENSNVLWNPTKSAKKMLLLGWCNLPRGFPGLLQDQITASMITMDIDLSKVFFKVRRRETEINLTEDESENTDPGDDYIEISAMAILRKSKPKANG